MRPMGLIAILAVIMAMVLSAGRPVFSEEAVRDVKKLKSKIVTKKAGTIKSHETGKPKSDNDKSKTAEKSPEEKQKKNAGTKTVSKKTDDDSKSRAGDAKKSGSGKEPSAGTKKGAAKDDKDKTDKTDDKLSGTTDDKDTPEKTPPILPGDKPGETDWRFDPNRGKPKLNIPLTIGSVIVVSLFAYAAIKLYTAYTGMGGSSRLGRGRLMSVREKQMLGPNKQLCIVELPGKIVLLGVTDTEMKVLAELNPEDLPQPEANVKAGQDPSKPSPTSYLWDVVMRRWQQGGK